MSTKNNRTIIQALPEEYDQETEKLVLEKYPVVKKDPEKVVKYVVQEFQRYENYHRERFQRMERIYDHWKQVPPARDEDWMNQVPVPLIPEAEQTITPRVYTALFPNDAPLDIKAEGDAPAEQAIRIKSIVQHYFRVNNISTQSIPMLTQNTLYGTGYCESGNWCVKRGWQQDDAVRMFKIIESRPDFAPVDFFEMFPHPAKLKMEDPLPLIRRQVIDGETLKHMASNPRFRAFNLKDALESEFPAASSNKNMQAKKGEEYELLTYWGGYDDKIVVDEKVVERLAVPYWIMVINRSVMIRCIPNPYNHQTPPFCKVTLFEDPKPCWFGVGIGDMGLSTQERVNKIVNQRLDNVDLVLNKQGFYNGNDPMINKKKLEVAKPGQWHKVSDTVSSIRWMDTPDVTTSAYKEEELAKSDFRQSTGAVGALMPVDGQQQHRTAMGINLLQGAAGVRFKSVLAKIESDFIARTAYLYFSNLKQFMTNSEWVQITGKGGEMQPVLITPEQIRGKVFFIPTGISETINKEVQVGQLLRYREITANDPTVNRQTINRRIAELFGFKDLQELFTPIMPVRQDGMETDTMLRIQQRLAEGANPAQIKDELIGPRPAPQPMAQPGATPQ